MKKRAKFNLVPSRSLLRYLQSAVDDTRRRPGHIPWCNYSSKSQSTKSKRQRDESLNFLLVENAAAEHSTRQDINELHKPMSIRKESPRAVSKSQGNPVESRSDSFQVKRWIKRCREMSRNDYFNVDELRECIKLGQERNYPVTSALTTRLITRAVVNREFDFALDIFQKYFEPSGRLHVQTISYALEASFRLHNHEECERIYAKYMAKVELPLKTLHIVLKSFLFDYNFTLAKQFFHQLSDIATEETLFIYLVGISKLAHNPKELEEALYRWTAKRGPVGAQLYAIVLEGLMTLRPDNDDFDRFYNNVIKRDEDISCSEDIENVFIERALINQNQHDLLMHMNRLKRSRVAVKRRPFVEALKFLCFKKDTVGIGFVVHQLSAHNIKVDDECVSLIATALCKRNADLNLLEFLAQLEPGAYSDTRAINTVKWVWKTLLQRYPNRGQSINSKLRRYVRENISGLKHEDIFRVANKSESSDLRDSVIVHDTINRHSPLAVLRRINKYNIQHEPEQGVKELETIIRKGAIPVKDSFVAVLRGLLKHNRTSEFDRIYRLMLEAGHDATTPGINVLLLRNGISQISQDDTLHPSIKRREALARIDQFLNDTSALSGLSLHDRCAVARELMNWKDYKRALQLYDSLRDANNPITSACHDSYSLTGMLMCYRKLNHLSSSVSFLNILLNSPVTIPINWHVFEEVRKSIVQARFTKNYAIMYQLEEQNYKLKTYRQKLIQQAEKTTILAAEMLKEKTSP